MGNLGHLINNVDTFRKIVDVENNALVAIVMVKGDNANFTEGMLI